MPRRRIPGDPKIAIAYVRVSTREQRLGPEAQRSAIEAWAAREGVTIAAWFEDHGLSGATEIAERPGLVDALAALRTHGAGVLVASKRDRVARDAMVAIMIERAAEAVGATLRTADGSSDVTGPEGVMMRGIVDVFASYERAVIRARTKAALAAKKAKNERLGVVPFGYRIGADGVHLERDEDEQKVIATIRRLRARGMPLRTIVDKLEGLRCASRAGKPLALTQVARIVKSAA